MENIIGKEFGNLTVIRKNGKNKENRYIYECICTCGNIINTYKNQLDYGNRKSCGCVKSKSNVKHGMRGHRLYATWRGILNRTLNKKDKEYENYGGRGIKVCDRWLDIKNFVEDMFPTHKNGLSIDRINNNGNYEPSNCRWATSKEQGINKRDTVLIELNGVVKPLTEWATIKKIKRATMYMRYRRGYSNEEIINGKK